MWTIQDMCVAALVLFLQVMAFVVAWDTALGSLFLTKPQGLEVKKQAQTL